MNPIALQSAHAKQKQTIARLTRELRAERILTNALSKLRWHKHHQSPHAIERLRRALDLKQQTLAGTPQPTAYPTGRSKAA